MMDFSVCKMLFHSLYVVLLASFCHALNTPATSSDIRDLVGLGSDGTQSSRRAVVVFAGNISHDETGGSTIDDEDLIGLAMDMEDHDPNSLYVHFDGDNLVSSQPSLFEKMEDVEGKDSWASVVDRVKSHRPGQETPLADLLVFESLPDDARQHITQLCDSTYSGGKCKIRQANIRIPEEASSLRFRRQAPVTTTTPTPSGNDRQKILPAMPYTAAFQLLFWVTLAIFLTVYGVAWGMWNMDPGRDSIIYRMTSAQKYKKDK